jgi:hypothetical protein
LPEVKQDPIGPSDPWNMLQEDGKTKIINDKIKAYNKKQIDLKKELEEKKKFEDEKQWSLNNWHLYCPCLDMW